jgi:hypothetical protein
LLIESESLAHAHAIADGGASTRSRLRVSSI